MRITDTICYQSQCQCNTSGYRNNLLELLSLYVLLLLFQWAKEDSTITSVSVQSTDIPPKENVTYAKQTQTTASGVTELRDGKLTLSKL